MAEPRTKTSRIGRLAVVAGGVCLLAGAVAPAAAAGLGLPAPTDSGLSVTPVADLTETATLTSDLAPLEEAAGQALEGPLPEAVATLPQTVVSISSTVDQPLPVAPVETVQEATETLAQTTAPVLTQATEAVAQTTAPVLEPVQQTQLLPATVETLAAVTESAGIPLAPTFALVEGVTQSLLPQTLPVLDAVLDPMASARGGVDVTTTAGRVQPVVTAAAAPSVAADVVATESTLLAEIAPTDTNELSPIAAPTRASSSAPRTAISASRETGESPVRSAAKVPPADIGPSDFPAPPSLPGGHDNTVTSSGATASSPPGIPAPFAPGGPLSGLAFASATAGAGALVPLLAALAAAILLAAPGLGRRLRPKLAPWPQPILSLSLERPG